MATETKKDNRVELFIPRGSANDEPNLVIGINGKNYVLPEVAAEYERSVKAQEKLDETIDKLKDTSK